MIMTITVIRFCSRKLCLQCSTLQSYWNRTTGLYIHDLLHYHQPARIHSEILQSTIYYTLSAGDKDQLPILGIQHHGTSCLELSVSSYEKFCYHHHFQGKSEN